jgi:hypothetical protein
MAIVSTPAFAELLQKAVTEPGTLSRAYSQFRSARPSAFCAWPITSYEPGRLVYSTRIPSANEPAIAGIVGSSHFG